MEPKTKQQQKSAQPCHLNNCINIRVSFHATDISNGCGPIDGPFHGVIVSKLLVQRQQHLRARLIAAEQVTQRVRLNGNSQCRFVQVGERVDIIIIQWLGVHIIQQAL